MTVALKELKTRMRPSSMLYEIYYEGGGEVPAELKGEYTSYRFTESAIKTYLVNRESKGKTRRGPTQKASGDKRL